MRFDWVLWASAGRDENRAQKLSRTKGTVKLFDAGLRPTCAAHRAQGLPPALNDPYLVGVIPTTIPPISVITKMS